MSDTVDHTLCVRAWGIPDRRVASGLAHENDPGLSQLGRAKVVGERAREAGWPAAGWIRSRDQATTAMQRLEGADFTIRTRQHRYRQRQAAYESRRPGMVTTIRGGVLPAEEPSTRDYGR